MWPATSEKKDARLFFRLADDQVEREVLIQHLERPHRVFPVPGLGVGHLDGERRGALLLECAAAGGNDRPAQPAAAVMEARRVSEE